MIRKAFIMEVQPGKIDAYERAIIPSGRKCARLYKSSMACITIPFSTTLPRI